MKSHPVGYIQRSLLSSLAVVHEVKREQIAAVVTMRPRIVKMLVDVALFISGMTSYRGRVTHVTIGYDLQRHLIISDYCISLHI